MWTWYGFLKTLESTESEIIEADEHFSQLEKEGKYISWVYWDQLARQFNQFRIITFITCFPYQLPQWSRTHALLLINGLLLLIFGPNCLKENLLAWNLARGIQPYRSQVLPVRKNAVIDIRVKLERKRFPDHYPLSVSSAYLKHVDFYSVKYGRYQLLSLTVYRYTFRTICRFVYHLLACNLTRGLQSDRKWCLLIAGINRQ